MRYHVCLFPSLYGTPVKTNYKLLAYLIGWARAIRHGGLSEVRIIDKVTGGHIVLC